jgi:hypothetical protein
MAFDATSLDVLTKTWMYELYFVIAGAALARGYLSTAKCTYTSPPQRPSSRAACFDNDQVTTDLVL